MAAVSCDVSSSGSGDSLTLDVAQTAAAHSMEITAPGPLLSRVLDERACFWFVAVDGTEVSIIWPPGSSARIDPLRIVNRDGHVIATTGQAGLSFSGSFLEGRAGCLGPQSQTFVTGAVTRPA